MQPHPHAGQPPHNNRPTVATAFQNRAGTSLATSRRPPPRRTAILPQPALRPGRLSSCGGVASQADSL